MKKRIIFEPEDFGGCGQSIIRNSSPEGKLPHVTLAYKIGFRREVAGSKICLISYADGMINDFDTIEDLCENLNDDDFGYRPMTTEELEHIARDQGNRFSKQ